MKKTLARQERKLTDKKATDKKNILLRGTFIFGIYMLLIIIILALNFSNSDPINKINNFEYWGMFFFAVYLLFAWKRKASSKTIWLLKLLTTVTIFTFICVMLFIPIMIPKHVPNSKVYNGIGIIIFSAAWFIEMFLFWTSESKKT